MFDWAVSIKNLSVAVTCIFLAVEMDDAELPFYTYWILTAHIVCYVVSHGILSVNNQLTLK